MKSQRRRTEPEPIKIPKELEQAYEWPGGGDLVCRKCGQVLDTTWWIDEMEEGERHWAVEAIKNHDCTFIKPEELKRLMDA